MEPDIIFRYFEGLSEIQISQLRQLWPLYADWNSKINVISRKDIDNLYERHVLHSLAIAKITGFEPGMKVLDAGTGGGFPGIPLAILFPETHFHLIDSTAKKLSVVEAVASTIGLKNITAEHCRFEDHPAKYDYIVSRAVASLDQISSALFKNIRINNRSALPNGILYLKGGDIEAELNLVKRRYHVYDLGQLFTEEFFQTKKLVHIY